MIRSTLAVLGLCLALATPGLFADGPGNPYCFGVGCPCGNDDPDAGCVNSSGHGALLDVTGSASIAADDAVFHVTQMPKHAVSILIAGRNTSALPFRDGLWCLGGGAHRLDRHLNSGSSGSVDFEHVVGLMREVYLTVNPGDTWNFQAWLRDSPAKNTPCGQKHNTSNGYAITFTP